MRGPDFVVVGAPKCGTTALHQYLSRNPNLYLAPKEPNFFGEDLEFAGGRMNRTTYEALFPASSDRPRGDISVWYLVSHTAAKEIRDFNPAAKIIIMLRNPVDQMYSMHSQSLHVFDEYEPSFTRALELESRRKRGEAVSRLGTAPHAVFYRELATYSTQIQRYTELFPPAQMHFILLEDLQANPGMVWDDLHAFLDIDPGARPEMEPINANKTHKIRAVATATMFVPRVVVPRLGMHRLPRSVKDRMISAYQWVATRNRSYVSRDELDPHVRRELAHEFRHEIGKMEEILHRDLSHWRC